MKKKTKYHRLMFQPATWKLYAIMLIPLLLYVGFTYVPLVYGAYCSMFRRVGLLQNKFVGLNNYVALMQDPEWWQSVKNTMLITLFCVSGQIGMAIIFTVFMSYRWVRLKGAHRALFFMPSIISGVVMGYIWQILFSDRNGLINALLNAVGLPGYGWLVNASTILLVVSIPTVWQSAGYYMMLMLGGLSGIGDEILEAAEIDGANDFQVAMRITLPLLKDTILVALMLCISFTMKIFDHVNIMTKGGPGSASTVMAQYAYEITFTAFNTGYGATISTAMFVLTTAVVIIFRRLAAGGDKDAN